MTKNSVTETILTLETIVWKPGFRNFLEEILISENKSEKMSPLILAAKETKQLKHKTLIVIGNRWPVDAFEPVMYTNSICLFGSFSTRFFYKNNFIRITRVKFAQKLKTS